MKNRNSFIWFLLMFMLFITSSVCADTGSPPVISSSESMAPPPLVVTVTPLPNAATSAATAIGGIYATVNGTASAENSTADVTFEYGLTTSYGSSVTATPSQVSGSTPTTVSAFLNGLILNTTYHFRVCATNSCGTTCGDDMTFTTAPSIPTLSQWGLIILTILLIIVASVSIYMRNPSMSSGT